MTADSNVHHILLCAALALRRRLDCAKFEQALSCTVVPQQRPQCLGQNIPDSSRRYFDFTRTRIPIPRAYNSTNSHYWAFLIVYMAEAQAQISPTIEKRKRYIHLLLGDILSITSGKHILFLPRASYWLNFELGVVVLTCRNDTVTTRIDQSLPGAV